MPHANSAAQQLPYASDPDDRAGNTSRAGALAIAADVKSLQARYVRLLYARRGFGATDQEAADTLGIQRTTLIPRRTELGARVKWSGAKRSHVVRGRMVPNKVWALAVFVDDVIVGRARGGSQAAPGGDA